MLLGEGVRIGLELIPVLPKVHVAVGSIATGRWPPSQLRSPLSSETDLITMPNPWQMLSSSVCAITIRAQRPSVHLTSFKPRQLRRPKERPPEGSEAWNSQSTPADRRAWKLSNIKKSGLSRSCLVLQARTPLTIVAHILPGRRLVVRPTRGPMQKTTPPPFPRPPCFTPPQ